MTDRLFADCCYGSELQHMAAQPCPQAVPADRLEMHFDSWTGSYRDRFNDFWVLKRPTRKLWEVASREPGNQVVLHSRHRDLGHAIAAAQDAIRARHLGRLQA